MHKLTVDLADDIYELLLREAQRVGRTPAEVAAKRIAASSAPHALDPLLQLLGSIETDVTDVAQRHDEYIGDSLSADSR